MTDNLALWESVERTDPAQTKKITGKPYQGTSPKPYYLVHEATKAFGPCGIGWGFEIVSERVEAGSGDDKVHIAHIRVWYMHGDKRGVVEHVGQTMFCGKRNDGKLYTDEDAPKKSVTDGLVKALSMIGFAGDIFMGRYDDSKYVNEVAKEIAQEKRAESAPPTASAAGETEAQRKYAADFLLWLGKADLQQVRSVWKAEQESRLSLGIRGTSLERELRAAWEARGVELKGAQPDNVLGAG